MKTPVYLDYNATTPCDPRVVETMVPYFSQHFGNAASRTHQFGIHAREAVGFAREQVAQLVAAEPKEIIFTSGATEAVNLALKGIFEAYATKGNHIITCSTEHRAVLDTCRQLEKKGVELTSLRVDKNGGIDLGALESAISATTILIVIMYANNETGVIMPVKAIAEIAKRKGVLFFSDATQAVGKIPVNVVDDGIDLMAFSSHKIYGPKGVGALYVRRKNPRVRIVAQIDGGGHEEGLRSGTLNVPGIVGFGKACEIAQAEMKKDGTQIGQLRDKLEQALTKTVHANVNGDRESRLPHVSNVSFGGVKGENLLPQLAKDLAVSSGSACTSALPAPSHVLKAMGLDDELAHSSLRFSLGRFTTEEEINFAIEKVAEAVKNNSLKNYSYDHSR